MQTVYNRSTENWTSIVEKLKIHTIHNTFKIKQKYFYSRPSKWTPGLVYSLLQVHNSRKQLGNASPRKVIWPWLKSLEVASRYRHYTPEARTGTAKPAKQCASCISIRVLSFLLSTKVPVMLLFFNSGVFLCLWILHSTFFDAKHLLAITYEVFLTFTKMACLQKITQKTIDDSSSGTPNLTEAAAALLI